MQREDRLVLEMLGAKVGDEDEAGEQRQGQQREARADQPEHHFLERIERRQHASADRAMRRARSRRSRNTSTSAVTAAASSSAAAAMDSRICAVSSQPGAVSSA